MKFSNLKNIHLIIFLIFLTSCGGDHSAKDFPPEPEKRVKKNLEEGRGFRLGGFGKPKSGDFDFASSNELWRASLDTIDFMPLVSANYSGGIIITDWYSEGTNFDESIKISIRFLTNEIRADALSIKIFYKNCSENTKCQVIEKSGNLGKELKKKILMLAATYKKQIKDKNFKEYPLPKDKIN